MLLELKVANFALIENLTWQAVPGLNVLTGETGAGKSIVIGAISLLLGERAAAEQVRLGAETAVIEGLFQVSPALRPEMDALLESAGIAPDDLLILGRELSRSGRSVGRVNGRAVPVSFL
ncbi:MAG TPA: AAA family ATPase, partial [Bacillota bacterium]|nr:AAA family ATPase [Bacillota bacterium]